MQARIIINFTEEKYSALTQFTKIVEVISDWKNSEPIFQGIKVEKKESMNYLFKKRIDLEASDIAKYIKKYDQPDNLFASGVGFNCWRFKDGEAKRGYSRIDIDVWGTGHEMYKDNDVAVDGLSWLYLNHAGPFCAVVGEKKDEYREANEKVAENLDDLTDLLLIIGTRIKPNIVRVVPDGGISIPLNSNSTFFSSYSSVIADLNFIGRIWEEGLPKYQDMPALKNYVPSRHEYLLHEWRTEEQRKELWKRLSRVIDRIPLVTESTVEDVLNTGRFDFYDTDEHDGFLVLEEPFYFNNFIDRFYLEILEKV